MKNKIVHVDRDIILKTSEAYFCKICGFHKADGKDTERLEEAMELRSRFQEQFVLSSMISVYAGCRIPNEKVDREKVKATVIYAMSMKEIDNTEELDMLEQFYLDTWMTAILDAGRDWLKGYLQEYFAEAFPEELFVTDSFGPGFYGMGIEMIPEILKDIDVAQIGIELLHGTMKPVKSNIGFYLAMSEEIVFPNRDCKNCLADHKNCLFCKNYK